MYLIQVATANPKEPGYLRYDSDHRVWHFTWDRPTVFPTYEDAEAVKESAKISCGGTLSIVQTIGLEDASKLILE